MGNFKVHSSSSSDKNARKNPNEEKAIPLKQVVAECERQWFDQTLKAAKAGETAMQTLVGQMLCSGYGASVNVKEGILWLQKAAEKDQEAQNLLASLSCTHPNLLCPAHIES
ncbi:unnamed protein product [Sphagnum balticum]